MRLIEGGLVMRRGRLEDEADKSGVGRERVTLT